MVRLEDDCVGCQLPCLGSACPYKNVLHFYCDVCENEVEEGELWDVDGTHMCEDCLKDNFLKVTADDYAKAEESAYDAYVDREVDRAREEELFRED